MRRGFTTVGVVFYLANLGIWWAVGSLAGFLAAVGLVVIDVILELKRYAEARNWLHWYDGAVSLLIVAQTIAGIVWVAILHLG